jgi:prepilin-type N-terminal cleavage/methylation domain-containing protein
MNFKARVFSNLKSSRKAVRSPAFSLIEVVVAMAIFAIISTSFAVGIIQIYQLTQKNWIQQTVRDTVQGCINQIWGFSTTRVQNLALGNEPSFDLKVLKAQKEGKIALADQTFVLNENTNLDIFWSLDSKDSLKSVPVNLNWKIIDASEEGGCFIELTYSYKKHALKDEKKLHSEVLRIFRAYP